MHFNEDELYFFFKGDIASGTAAAVREHLKECALCRKKMVKVEKISALIRGGLKTPPEMKLMPKAYNKTYTWPIIFKPRFAVIITLVIAVSVLLIYSKISVKTAENESASQFVLQTYKTVYDYDYYSEHYQATTKLTNELR